MLRHMLTDEQWELVADLFAQPKKTGRPPSDRRMVLNGILWIMRTGAPWRDLPEDFGPWQTVWRLFDEWNADGTLDKILHCLRAGFVDEQAELWCFDGTIVRAARCAGGGGKKATPRSLLTTP